MRAKFLSALLPALLAFFAIPVLAATTSLPGGTSFDVTVVGPHDGDVFPEGIPITVSGRANIGTAAPIANTVLVTIIDVSGSTGSNAGTTLCGNRNPTHDSASNTVLDCELAAAKAVNNDAVASGTVASVGVIAFAGRIPNTTLPLQYEAAPLDLAPGGTSPTLVAPAADADNNGTRDVETALASAYNRNVIGTTGIPAGDMGVGFTSFSTFTSPGNTNYWAAITQLKTLLSGVPSTSQKVVVMLSDGDSNVGSPTNQNVTAALAGIDPAIRIFTFAIGSAASCTGTAGVTNYGTLKDISDATHGTCQRITDPGAAVDAVPDAIRSKISTFGLNVTGSTTVFDPATTVTPVPPATLVSGSVTGPATVNFARTYPAPAPGPHTLCASAIGTDGGGSAQLTDCVNITVKARPTVTLNGGTGTVATIPEGSSLAIGATVTGATTTQWSVLPTGTCTFADPSAVATTITCTNQGTFTLSLTAHDGVNADVTSSQTLAVTNVAPVPTLTLSGALFPVGTTVGAHVDITDPGNDGWTCQFDFDNDGTVDATTVTLTTTTRSCDASHTYAAAGDYTVRVVVLDDVADTGSALATLTIKAPPSVTLDGGTGTTDEGTAFAVGATVSGATTTHWSSSGGTGSCSFADPSAAHTSITCDDNGAYALTFTATDQFGQSTTASQTLNVNNVAPTLVVSSPSAGASPRAVTFTGTVTDPGTGDTETCTIDWGDGHSDTVPAPGGACSSAHTYATSLASATLDAFATDDDGGMSAHILRALTFNRPPSCTVLRPSLSTLWEPNHTMVLVTLSGATDPDTGDTLTYAITGVTQDEPTFGLGSGDFGPDAQILAGGQVMLRAERDGSGDGRVYTIAFTITDGSGATCSGTVDVSVPHDKTTTAIKSSHSYNSLIGDDGKKNK